MRPIAHFILMILVSVTVVFLFELIVRSYVFPSWLLLWKTGLSYAAVGAAIMFIGLVLWIFRRPKWKIIVPIAWIAMLAVELLGLAGVVRIPEFPL